ncbi:alpha/beta hydrolase [Saccharothrix sp. NPDC042600]|uniref:alpha/beta hydrolase n=1 Tax=Saccharothrix TaxID=2071 RepID=UPI0033ED1CA1
MALLIAVVVIAAGVLIVVSKRDRQAGTRPAPSTTGTPSAGLARFYNQRLTWSSCPEAQSPEPDNSAGTAPEETISAGGVLNVECANMDVPLDYEKPDERTMRIALVRRKATGDRIGSLIVNPGGPGGSGRDLAAQLAASMGESDLGARFDLVGFDPRGVGRSEPPVRCLTDAERDADRLDDDVDTSPAGVAQTEAEIKAYVDKCAANTGRDVLAHIGTREVVRDLDVMRSVLGDQKLTFLGYSYGTQIGAQYAATFPDKVRALVLDGAVDPTVSGSEMIISQYTAFQKAFTAYATWCSQQPECPLGPDPAQATTTYQQLVRPLIGNPMQAGDRKLSYGDATIGTIQAMYGEYIWEHLSRALTGLRNQDGKGMLELADAYLGRSPEGNYQTLNDAGQAIRCADSPPITDRTRLDDAARRLQAAVPFIDSGYPAAGILDACAFWPVPPSTPRPVAAAPGFPMTLVISATGDPATPYEWGVNLAAALHARLVTFEANAHAVSLKGNECLDPIVIRYLITLEVPADGQRCA